MEIREVVLFRAIVEAGGLTKAAALKHMTPGALSKALSRFEEGLGRPLFHRTGRRLVLTDLGARLYQRSARLIEEHARLTASLEVSDEPDVGALRIASFEVFTTHALAAVISEAFAEREVQVLETRVGAIEDAVREREVDMGVTDVPAPHRELTYLRIGEMRFGIWGHGPTFAGQPFSELPFAIPVTRLQLAAGELLGIYCWPYDRVPRRVRYRLTSLESALALARARQCVVFIPDFVGTLQNRGLEPAHQLHRIPSPRGLGTITQTARVVARAEHADSPVVKEVVRAYRSII